MGMTGFSRAPFPRWTVLVVVAVVLVVTAAVLIGLWWWVGTLQLGVEKTATTRLEAVKIASGIAVGGGGVFALYLAVRRQRAQELELAQRDDAHQLAVRVAEHSEKDAAARRLTELYAKSVEQLGSEKAPVRLGGLYALERLAQDDPGQRQTIVNVLCAYLRMPFSAEQAAESPATDEIRKREEEKLVRSTAQNILKTHLTPDSEAASGVSTEFWPRINLDLAGANLVDFSLSDCVVNAVEFGAATFVGSAHFERTTFEGAAGFAGSTFVEAAVFRGARFAGPASFRSATLRDYVDFGGVRFDKEASFEAMSVEDYFWKSSFDRVRFGGATSFNRAVFAREVDFDHSVFSDRVSFEEVHFEGRAYFMLVEFNGACSFFGANFLQYVNFDSCVARSDCRFWGVTFAGDVYFRGAKFDGYVDFLARDIEAPIVVACAKFQAGAHFSGATFAGDLIFADDAFTEPPDFEEAQFLTGPPKNLP